MADYIRPTPRSPILGLLADALTGGVDWMRDPRRAQQMQGLGGLLAETGIPAVVERLSYGEPLTTGRGMTTRLRPEAESALMTLGPEAVPIGRGAMAAVRATKGLPVGAGIKNVGSEAYLQSLRPVDVFGNGRRIDYYDDAKGIMYSAQEYPKGTRWTAYDVLPKFEGGNQVIGEMDRHRSFADVVAGVRGARISEAAKDRNAKYAAIPNTWSGEAKKIGKSLIDAGVEIDRVTSSTQSKSKYIYLENGKKIRISDHELPNAYDAPEFDFRYGGDIKSLVKQIKDDQVAQTFEYPQEEALRIAQQRAALPVSEGGLGLPPNNTPMDRAKAMGFESGWAHGSPRGDITELRSSRIGAQGPGAYATNYLPEASTYSGTGEGATVYPLMVRKSEAINTKFNNPYDELGVNADDALLSELFGRNKSAIITTQEKTPDWLLKAGAVDMPQRQHFVSVRPENFRSRFAAFDPTRRNEPDLLAGALPFTALLDEENRARLEEQLGGLLGR